MSAHESTVTVSWDSIADAYRLVLAGEARRIDGAYWSVYAVGSNIVRVDVRIVPK